VQGDAYLVEGILEVCEIIAAKLLAMVGQDVERRTRLCHMLPHARQTGSAMEIGECSA
jgi:hypothetical protein